MKKYTYIYIFFFLLFWLHTFFVVFCFSQYVSWKFVNEWFCKSNLSSTLSVLLDDDHWVIDTDYDNYAVHYSCRLVDADGTCLDGYSFIFSRHSTGLRPEDQPVVLQKKTDLCLLGKYRRVAHTGELTMLWFFDLWLLSVRHSIG